MVPESLSGRMTFWALQRQQREWVAHNFPGREPWCPLLGLQEEVGELSHAFLKRHQGIRTTEDHDAAMRDAVGDIVIFLADFCSANDIDLQKAVEETWGRVRQRDWRECPEDGGVGRGPDGSV